MLFYYFIAVLLFSSGIAIFMYRTYAYRINDWLYDIPIRSSFDYQNCKIDRSCWVPYTERIPAMPALRPPYMGINIVNLESNYKSVPLPTIFFNY